MFVILDRFLSVKNLVMIKGDQYMEDAIHPLKLWSFIAQYQVCG
jgi:hypothetical protein